MLQFQDPAEVATRGSGFLRAQEAESGRSFVTSGRRGSIDPLLAEAELRKAGVECLRVRTDQPFLHKLRHFFRNRGMAGKGAR